MNDLDENSSITAFFLCPLLSTTTQAALLRLCLQSGIRVETLNIDTLADKVDRIALSCSSFNKGQSLRLFSLAFRVSGSPEATKFLSELLKQQYPELARQLCIAGLENLQSATLHLLKEQDLLQGLQAIAGPLPTPALAATAV